MAKRKQTKKYSGYTLTESELIRFGLYVLMGAFICLAVAGIITDDPGKIQFAIGLGLLIAYGIHKKWFNI